MATLIDLTKPIYKVKGHIPDGRYMICFVNANSEDEATKLGKDEGLIDIVSVYEIDPDTGLKKVKE